ncbi:DgyrCDS14061 [Dimorphilus gyrociliatus]|nr:DgyrCDS14061 [Dimorphilus gyrociliatus]
MDKIVFSTRKGYEFLIGENFNGALSELKKCLTYAEQIQKVSVINKCVQNLAAAYIECGKEDDIKRGIELLTPLIDNSITNESAYRNFNLAIGYEKLKNFEKSVKLYEKTLKQIERSKSIDFDDQDLHNLCYSLSKIYVKDGKVGSAALVNSKISKLCISSRLQIDFLINTARYLYQAKDYERSYEYLKQILEKYSVLDIAGEYSATVNNTIGILFTQIGALQLAVECFERARAVSRKLKNNELVAVSSQNLGVVMNLSDQYRLSLKFHKEAFQIYEEIQVNRYQAETAINLAYAYFKTNKLQECEECLLTVINIGPKDLQWVSYGHMSALYYIQEDWESLKGCLIQSLKVAPKHMKKDVNKNIKDLENRVNEEKRYKATKLSTEPKNDAKTERKYSGSRVNQLPIKHEFIAKGIVPLGTLDSTYLLTHKDSYDEPDYNPEINTTISDVQDKALKRRAIKRRKSSVKGKNVFSPGAGSRRHGRPLLSGNDSPAPKASSEDDDSERARMQELYSKILEPMQDVLCSSDSKILRKDESKRKSDSCRKSNSNEISETEIGESEESKSNKKEELYSTVTLTKSTAK